MGTGVHPCGVDADDQASPRLQKKTSNEDSNQAVGTGFEADKSSRTKKNRIGPALRNHERLLRRLDRRDLARSKNPQAGMLCQHRSVDSKTARTFGCADRKTRTPKHLDT
jgi:hypothetical protein